VKKQVARTAALARKHEQKRRTIQAEKSHAGSDLRLRGLPLFDAFQTGKASPVVHPANGLRLLIFGAVEGSCLSAWEQGDDSSAARSDGW
jgi:hypothetical protein